MITPARVRFVAHAAEVACAAARNGGRMIALFRLWSRVLPIALMLIACASWEPTRKAIVRREAESRLRGCMSGTLCTQTKACVRESVEFCESQGLEATCGTDAAFISPIRCRL